MQVPQNTCIDSLNLIIGKEVPHLEMEKGTPLSGELFKAMRYNTQYSNAVIYNRFARQY